MGKPFDGELAREATRRTKDLVHLLNSTLKEFQAELGPCNYSDIIITRPTEPSVRLLVEVEIVRADRWERIKRGEFTTVRWPLAKKHKCEKYSKEGKVAYSVIG